MPNINTIIKVKNAGGGFDTLFPISKSENIIVDDLSGKKLSQKLAEIDSELLTFIRLDEKGVPNGVATLDASGIIPMSQLPAGVKEIRVVDTIVARNGLTAFEGMAVYVKNATGDPTVTSGGAYYIFDGAGWVKTAEAESMDLVIQWNEIQGKPTTLGGYGITDALHVSDATTAPQAGKLLRVNGENKLPANITGNADGNAGTASRLQTPRTITVSGDVDGGAVFDGSQDVNINVILDNTGVISGTYTKVAVDSKGRVTLGANLTAADIPNLDWSKITTGKPTTVDGFGITDALHKTGDAMTGFLTLHANPEQPMHAATKDYVDTAVQGLTVKQAVRVATVDPVELTGIQTVDGVALQVGDRVLVKDQADAKQNGVYVVSVGDWQRSVDFDDVPDTEINGGEFVFVQEGSVNADMGFVLVTNAPVRVGTDPMNFSQFSGAGQVIAGVGLAKSGNMLYLANTGVVSGTYTKVTVDSQGRVTSATNLVAADIPNLDWSKITTGKPTSAVEDIDDAVARRHSHANKAVLDKITENALRPQYNGRNLAFQDEASTTVLSSTEPVNLPVNGLWFQTV